MHVPTLNRQGPVAYWRPHQGARHALDPAEPPAAGQQRATLCGEPIELVTPRDTDWFWPTCADCWALACERRDARTRLADASHAQPTPIGNTGSTNARNSGGMNSSGTKVTASQTPSTRETSGAREIPGAPARTAGATRGNTGPPANSSRQTSRRPHQHQSTHATGGQS